MSAEEKNLFLETALAFVQQRRQLTVFSEGGDPQEKTYYVDEDGACLRWDPTEDEKSYRCFEVLGAVHRVQRGWNTVNMGQRAEELRSQGVDPQQCFSLITFHGSADFMAQNVQEADLWCAALSHLAGGHEGRRSRRLEDAFIRALWLRYDRDQSGSLDVDEVCRLLDHINVDIPKKRVKKAFEEVDVNGSGVMEYDEFLALREKLLDMSEFDELFGRYATGRAANGQPLMTVADFVRFLAQEQKEVVTEQVAEAILADPDLNLAGRGRVAGGALDRPMFVEYLRSPGNEGFDKSKAGVYMDMDQPLSHYYIASSHNTYLEGDQLQSSSSVNMYINAFYQGCRCVELDCWDGDDGEPVIYHGHTLTSRITFRDVIQATKDYAFVVSPYPVILSFENHCSAAYQRRMAEHVQEILGDAVVTLPDDISSLQQLPSPNQLKYKILIKDKRSKSNKPAVESHEKDDSDSSDDEDEKKAEAKPKKKSAIMGLFGGDKKEEKKDEKVKSKSVKAAELASLVYLDSVKFVDVPTDLSRIKCWEIVSFSEGALSKLAAKASPGSPDSWRAVIAMHSKKLSRVYPSGIRFDSSNYDPTAAWLTGAQVVALNYQRSDAWTVLNHAKFSINGRSGYVLKPAAMIPSPASPIPRFHPTHGPFSHRPLRYTIKVISAINVPKPDQSEKGEVVDPYVRIYLCGLPQDSFLHNTPYIDDNGFHPVWNATHSFVVHEREVATLVMMVYDKDLLSKDDQICSVGVPLVALRTGYRFLPLMNKKRHLIPLAGLFIHVAVESA